MDFIVNGDPKEYKDYVNYNRKGHFLQTLEWAKVKEDWGHFYFVIKDTGLTKGAGLVLIRNIPFLGKNFLYCPRGPVLNYNDRSIVKFFAEQMRKAAKKYNAFMLKVDPDLEVGEKEAVNILASLGFSQKPLTLNFEGIQPRFVSRLDITRSTDAILKDCQPKTRYNIRLAARKGVTIRRGERADLGRFQEIMEETGLRDNFIVRNLTYFQRMWDQLVTPGYMRLYLAEYKGQVVSGAINIFFGDKCWYLYGASSNQYRNVMPNYLLQWTMIQDAKEAGCTIYDFRGISGDPDPSNPLYGLYRFKRGFNGQVTEFIGEHDLIFDQLLYKLWDKGLPFLKKVRSKLVMTRNAVEEVRKRGQMVGS